jgi:SEC-C motif-containing protein
MLTSSRCPCGRQQGKAQPLAFDDCCGPYLSGARWAPDAQVLMRSRYTAFVRADAAYLLATWHVSNRPAALELDASVRWLGLEVRLSRVTGEDSAEVEFVARYRVAGRAVRQHELSRFVREGERWFYKDGDAR